MQWSWSKVRNLWGSSTDFFGPETKQLVETYARSQQSQQIPQGGKIQNGDTGNNKDLPPNREVGDFHRFQRLILPHTDSKSVQEVSAFSCPESYLKHYRLIWPQHP